MARFFIITINYAPEPSGFAPHATQLAEYLARRGHDVAVFTGFPFAPRWRRRDEDRGRLFSRERTGSVTVHRVTHHIPRRPSSAWQRIAMEGSFSASVFVAMLCAIVGTGRPDAFLYIGAQPAAAMLARLTAALTRRPYFVRITDLAAQAAREVGVAGVRLSRMLERFEFAAYRQAAGASVLCESFQDALITHEYPRERIRVLHNPIDVRGIRPVTRTGSFRARYAIPSDAFVLLHAGSMGRKQALLTAVAAADLVRGTPIHWIFVGDGEMKDELARAVSHHRVEDSVHFVPFQPDAALSNMFADADVLFISQIASVQDTLIPGKLLTYMAAGRPVLAAVHPASQAALLLRSADGGVLVPPEDAEALAAAARQLATTDRVVLDAAAARNRAYAEQHFDERTVLAAHEEFLMGRLTGALNAVVGPASARRQVL
jgi:glycosyltransferase involved in cell wall biosynthesis